MAETNKKSEAKPKKPAKRTAAKVESDATLEKKKATTEKSEPTLDKKPQKWPWGVWATLGWALLMFILPQLIIGSFLSAEQLDEVSSGENISLNFGVLVAGEIVTFIFLISILGSRNKSLKDIFVVPAKIADNFLAIPVYGIYVVSAAVAFLIAGQLINNDTLEQQQEIGFETASATAIEQILIFIGLVVLVPFIEEALFRGFMLKGFVSRIGWLPAAILSSLLFGLAHLQLNVAIDTFLLGLAAAWLVYFSRSIWPAVTLHAIKNGIAFLILFEHVKI